MADRTTWTLEFKEDGLDGVTRKVTVLRDSVGRLGASHDQYASSASRAAASAQGLIAPVERGGSAVERASGAMKAAEGSSVALGAALRVGAAAVDLIGSSLERAVDGLVKFDQHATRAFGERTATLRAYTTILGDATQAQVEYSKANQLAAQTELTSASTLKAQQALIVAGFRGKDLDKALTATLDVASTKQPEERELTTERVGRALSQILAAGKLRGQELNQLAEAGLNRGQVLELLGKGDSAAGEKRISSGGVSAQEGIEAVYSSILQTLGTKKLGEFATSAAGSLAGELSNREEALDILLKSFDGETTPAVKRYVAALHEQNSTLSTTSQGGKELVLALSDIAGVAANVKTEFTEFSTGFVETFVSSFNAVRDELGQFSEGGDGLRGLGASLGRVGAYAGEAVNWFDNMRRKVVDLNLALSGAVALIEDLVKRVGKYLPQTYYAKAGDYVRENVLGGPTRQYLEQYGRERKVRDFLDEKVSIAGKAFKTSDQLDAELLDSIASGPKLRSAAQRRAAVETRFGKTGGGSGRGSGGGFALDLGFGGPGQLLDTGTGSSSLQDTLQQATRAAAQVSSAPSSQAQAGASQGQYADRAGVSIAGDVNIQVVGSPDAKATAEEVWRVFTQRAGRLSRAVGGARL